MRQVRVVDVTSGATLAARAVLADTVWTRFLGLQGRAALPPGTGLVLLPCASIHMLFMRMRIDAIFVAQNGHVLRVARSLRPWTLGPVAPGALYCVELPDGAAADTRTGDVIELCVATPV